MSITEPDGNPRFFRGGAGAWLPALIVTGVAAAVRLWRLTEPSALVFDENFYARDACYYALRSVSDCSLGGIPLEVHPPLGKWLMVPGIELFGFTPLGARIGPAIAGVLTVLLVFLMARKLFRSTLAATVAAGFLALDTMHVIHSRLAMLDPFLVLFTTAALLCIVQERDWTDRNESTPLIVSPWRLGAGFLIGGALATKWSGLFPVLAVIALAVGGDIARRPGKHRLDRTVRETGLANLICFVAVPVVVYVASHIGRFGLAEFWPQQLYMYDQLVKGYNPHPYAVSAWTWFLAQDAYPYYFDAQSGPLRAILVAGNPLMWVPALLAVGWILLSPKRGAAEIRSTILIGFLATWGPWALLALGGVGRTFLYYALPTLPLLGLALGWAILRLPARLRIGAALMGALTLVVSFGFMYPAITAVPMSRSDWEARTDWYDTCPPPSTDESVIALIRSSRGCRSAE